MGKFDVHVETLDRRSSFTVEWPADNERAVIAELKRDGGVDVAMDDDEGVEFWSLAGIRKITIRPAEEESADG